MGICVCFTRMSRGLSKDIWEGAYQSVSRVTHWGVWLCTRNTRHLFLNFSLTLIRFDRTRLTESACVLTPLVCCLLKRSWVQISQVSGTLSVWHLCFSTVDYVTWIIDMIIAIAVVRLIWLQVYTTILFCFFKLWYLYFVCFHSCTHQTSSV